GWRQVDLPVADTDIPPLEVDDKISAHDARLGPGRRARDVPQRDTDAREELIDAERLRHVIVGAEVESVDLVVLAAARGEHDDWRAGELADATDDLESVAVRQVQVEHDEVGLPSLVARDRVARGLRGLHLEAVTAEVRPERADHGRLVVD